jgi:YhcH/YjgK/YiaL family protein
VIIDTLSNADKYFCLNPRFAAAFRYLKNPAAGGIDSARDEIEGDKLIALVSRKIGKQRNEAKLEVHRKYIDIQFVLQGIDTMGWKPASDCSEVLSAYDEVKDIGFFADEPSMWCPVHAGAYAIFFPEDAHAPMVSSEEIHKIVLKVAV